MFKNPLLLIALAMTLGVATWGILDSAGLSAFAEAYVYQQFTSRAWFIMLVASLTTLTAFGLAISSYGSVRLGDDDSRPEFSTISWITMLFAAGMGVGLLFYGTMEPLSHFQVALDYAGDSGEAARWALFITLFNWGFHAWSIYALTGLAIAYFAYRKGRPAVLSAPIQHAFAKRRWSGFLSWVTDLLAIYAIAIGLAGSVAIGIFQVQDGVESLLGLADSGWVGRITIFVVLTLAFLLPLTVDLSAGMAKLSNMAMALAGFLLVFLLLVGPTHYLMNGIVDALGTYLSGIVRQSFATFPFFGPEATGWFHDWTLNYMVWWIAWAPFVGVFVARISRGRTVREFIIGVVIVPSLFSLVWFGVFGGIGFHSLLRSDLPIMQVVSERPEATTFFVLETLPGAAITGSAVVAAAFLFLVTSVVSAAFVLAMFSTGGDENPATRIKITWGAILAVLSLAMLMSGDLGAVRNIIAFGAIAFVFIMPIIIVALLRTLHREEPR